MHLISLVRIIDVIVFIRAGPKGLLKLLTGNARIVSRGLPQKLGVSRQSVRDAMEDMLRQVKGKDLREIRELSHSDFLESGAAKQVHEVGHEVSAMQANGFLSFL